MTDYAFIRVSTGSQDAQTQRRTILVAYPEAIIVTPDTKAASASKGEHLDAMDKLIAELAPGDRVVVTDSSRLDRSPDQWAQMARLISIKAQGAEVLDLSNPGFGSDDRFGVVMTALHQMENADKARTVKTQTYRGVTLIRDNQALYGVLPALWESSGPRYGKQAVCSNPDSVRDIYARVASGNESLSSIGRSHDLYVNSVKALIRFEANHTGLIQCSYTYQGVTETWPHKVTAVVDSDLWWRANKILASSGTDNRGNKSGRPVAQLQGWISGTLECPACGGRLYLNASSTPAGNPRTPKLRCCGKLKDRRSCGGFKGIDAQPVIDAIGRFFTGETALVLAYQRISGNQHELDALEAELAKLQGSLSAVTTRAERREAIAQIEALEDQVEAFTVIPDDYDYTETGQTIAGMWATSDDEHRRGMVRAVKDTGGIRLVSLADGEWVIRIMRAMPGNQGDIVNLGAGLCYRRSTPGIIAGMVAADTP